jgi:hypothetical protein
MAIVINGSGSVTGITTRLAAAAAPAGSVIQTVSATNTGTQSYSGTNTWHTAMSINITPTSATSKVFVAFNMNIGIGSTGAGSGTKILRGSTEILRGDAEGSRDRGQVAQFTCYSNNTNTIRYVSPSVLDSPSATSQVTYNFQVFSSSQDVYINRTHEDPNDAGVVRGSSFVYAMEIAA